MENLYFFIPIALNAVLMLIFGCLYLVERKRHILLWFLSWVLFMLVYISLFLYTNTKNQLLVDFLMFFGYILAFWLISKGSLDFIRGRSSKIPDILLALIVLFIINAHFFQLSDLFFIIPANIFATSLIIYTGIVSIQVPYVKSILRHTLGAYFILWGLINLAVVLTAPLGEEVQFTLMALEEVLAVTSAINLLVVFFQYSRENQAMIDEKMRHLIMYDSLTGVYNRGYFELEMARCDNEDYLPISVILGDLNGLKLINDTFGHNKGDRLLTESAALMKKAAPDHIIGRWGGDEFMILLPQTGLADAKEIVQRIKAGCREYKDGNIPLDISFGVAVKEKIKQSLSDTIENADSLLYKNKLSESRLIRNSIVNLLKNTLMEKNIETEEHVLRMKEMAYLVGRNMNLSHKEQEDLALVAFLHDIGKISIPDHILEKPDTLNPEEWENMKKHSEIGYRITLSSEEFAHISQSVLCHHERWDGTGYPLGLKGSDIPLLARIISVIDSYDAMTHTRIYRKAINPEKALEEITRCAGTQFDPQISRLFVTTMQDYIGKEHMVMPMVKLQSASQIQL